MGFAVVAILNPPWLRQLSSPGVKTESRGYKENGDALMVKGNHQRAVWWYEQALRIDPNYVGARVNLALAQGKLGNPEPAIVMLHDVLEGNPKGRGSILFSLGELLRQTGRIPEAAAAYREALEAGGPADRIEMRLGEAGLASGAFEQARQHFQAALRILEDPATPYTRMLKASLLTVGEDSVQIRAIQGALDRGVTEEDLARYDMEMVRRQLDLDHDRARALGLLGMAEARLRDPAAADHLRRSLKVWPDNPEAGMLRSALAEAEGRAFPPRRQP
jgi:tetratricopeptide (TPR) repeat protein